jgi:hypothetical protein
MTKSKGIKRVESDTQISTEKVDWELHEDAKSWIEVSIENNMLKPVHVATACSEQDPKKRLSETWRQYYYDWCQLGFKTYWYEKFTNEVKPRIRAKVYSQIDHLIEREKRLEKVVTVGEFIENKKGDTNIQINVTPIVDEPIYVVSESNSNQKDIQS